jgi:hypothetical protein
LQKIIFLLIVLLFCKGSSLAQTNKSEVKNLQKGKLKEDTSFVYSLPYKKGKSILVVQGYYTHYSHKTEIAIDFKMKKGTTICAARAGVVYNAKATSKVGGLKDENLADGNFIIIEHEDGSKAYYWHLQHEGLLVHKGDTVQQGQSIGYSGNTGYTAFPHLHFEVWGYNNNDKYQQLPIRFLTPKGPRYLRSMKRYLNP